MFVKKALSVAFCAEKHHHVRITELVKRMSTAQETLAKQQEDLKALRANVKEKEAINNQRNKQVHQMRERLTRDIQKAQQIWADSKKQVEKNKSEAIRSFATGLFELGRQLEETQKHESEQHSVQLKEGFQLTSRLFYSTLSKYNIKRTELKEKEKVRKGEFEKVGEQATEEAALKGTVAKVEEQGWTIEGKIAKNPKVFLYV